MQLFFAFNYAYIYGEKETNILTYTGTGTLIDSIDI